MSERRRAMARADSDGRPASLGVMKFDLDLCQRSLTALPAVLRVRWTDLEQRRASADTQAAHELVQEQPGGLKEPIRGQDADQQVISSVIKPFVH